MISAAALHDFGEIKYMQESCKLLNVQTQKAAQAGFVSYQHRIFVL